MMELDGSSTSAVVLEGTQDALILAVTIYLESGNLYSFGRNTTNTQNNGVVKLLRMPFDTLSYCTPLNLTSPSKTQVTLQLILQITIPFFSANEAVYKVRLVTLPHDQTFVLIYHSTAVLPLFARQT